MKTKLFQIILATLIICAAITCNLVMLLHFAMHHEPIGYIHAIASYIFSLIAITFTRILIDLGVEWRDEKDKEILTNVP